MRVLLLNQTFYPDVVAASQHNQAEVRMTAAWVMGQDNAYEDFHSALRPLLQDPNAGVRHNAALGLVRFGDSSGRPELIGDDGTSVNVPGLVAGWAELSSRFGRLNLAQVLRVVDQFRHAALGIARIDVEQAAGVAQCQPNRRHE